MVRFFSVHCHELALQPRLHGVCAGYESGTWRAEQLSRYLMEWLPEFSDFSNYLLNAEVGIEADITAGISLRVLAKDSYDSEPAAGREKNDLSVIAGLGVRL